MNDAAQRFAKLAQAYAGRLPGRLDGIRASLDAAALQVARDDVHKLHGTAGSYGFGAVSRAFAALEAALDVVLEGGKADIEGAYADCAAAVGEAADAAAPDDDA